MFAQDTVTPCFQLFLNCPSYHKNFDYNYEEIPIAKYHFEGKVLEKFGGKED